MKRLVAALILLALLLGLVVPWASAHANALFAHVSVDSQGEVTMRVVDFYGALVEGQQPTIYAAAPGGRPTSPVAMVESQPGTYRRIITVPGVERYTVTAEIVLAGELYRLSYDVVAGQGQPEQMRPMDPIDPEPGPNWNRILFVAAAALLLAGTAVALLKNKAIPEGE